jgi:hypothetical protein
MAARGVAGPLRALAEEGGINSASTERFDDPGIAPRGWLAAVSDQRGSRPTADELFESSPRCARLHSEGSSRHPMTNPIPTQIVPSPRLSERTPRQVERAFRALLDGGVALRPTGKTKKRPARLLSLGYAPTHAIELFDTTYYLTDVRQNFYVRFFVAYIVQPDARGVVRAAHPRLFYKDAALNWRSASHIGRQNGDFWIGKGDVETVVLDGEEYEFSRESTTDLPIELQPALEALCRKAKTIPTDDVAAELILRTAPEGRIEPYRDFTQPRRRAQADPRNRVNGGRSVAWFARKNDPTSLRFARGYEPDFDLGILETSEISSSLYGGLIRCFRILSRNRRIQYLFMGAPRHVWIIPPQALTTELSSYGVRTVDVRADDDLFVPGYEYHFVDPNQDPPALYSQIPEGWAGAASELDDARADASPWLDRIPIIEEFRKKVLRVPARGSSRARPR